MALSLSCTASLPPQQKPVFKDSGPHHLQSHQAIQTIVQKCVVPSISSSPPHESLRRGNWAKLICGASFEDVVDVRNLSLVYTLAGVDCIDCAADEAVVNAVNEGIDAAREIIPLQRPWVMISVNDHEDLHFRKAEFNPEDCPLDCSRPCERVCPADAILFPATPVAEASPPTAYESANFQGVITERCYGCGRCLPSCPYDKISARTYVRDAASTSQLLQRNDVDAIEIHTSARHMDSFSQLWEALAESIAHVKLVAIKWVARLTGQELLEKIPTHLYLHLSNQVSLPDIGGSTISSMNLMYSIMHPHLQCFNLWQLDGRPMSGDIGRGATRDTIAFAVRLAESTDRPQGFLQLAGGTNAHTIDYLKKAGLFQKYYTPEHLDMVPCLVNAPGSSQAVIGGVAYGGFARKIVGRVLRKLQSQHGISCIEDYPDYLLGALKEAANLVGPVKSYNVPSHLP